MLDPVVVDYGPVSRKAAKKLRNGRGRLLREVRGLVEDVLDELEEERAGKAILPVIVVYRYKRKKRRGGGIPFPFPFSR